MFSKIAEQGAPLSSKKNQCRIGLVRNDTSISDEDQEGLKKILSEKNFNGLYLWTHSQVASIINDEVAEAKISTAMVGKHRQGACKCIEI